MKFRELHFRVALLAVTVGFLLFGFRDLIFHQMPFIFANPQEDMSFGWYVPVFSLYVLWRERDRLAASLGHPDIRGFLLALPFLFIGFIGVRGVQVRFGVLAVSGILFSLAWAFFGTRTAKQVLFPALFLLFCIPLATFLDVVTVHLRLLATSVAYGVLKGFGADVIRQGTMISSGSGLFAIDVAEPCSGLRSIFALAALTAAYAYFSQPTWLRRGILFALSVPLAVIGNVSRILTICLVGQTIGGEFATGFYHDYSGYVVFAVAIVLMLACGELITRICGRMKPARTAEAAAPARAEAAEGCPGWRRLLPPVLSALVIAVMCLQAATPEVTVMEAPDVHLGELAGFTSETLPSSEAETTMLPKDTVIEKRRYVSEDGHWALVNLVVGGREKGSIHRPELCLPAQGFLMMDPHDLPVGETRWRKLTLAGNDGHDLGFAYTFFNQDGYRTSSHVLRIFRDVWDRSVHNRIDRWVMVTVIHTRPDDFGMASFLSKLKEVVK